MDSAPAPNYDAVPNASPSALRPGLVWFFRPSCPHCVTFAGAFLPWAQRMLQQGIRIQKVNTSSPEHTAEDLAAMKHVFGVPYLEYYGGPRGQRIHFVAQQAGGDLSAWLCTLPARPVFGVPPDSEPAVVSTVQRQNADKIPWLQLPLNVERTQFVQVFVRDPARGPVAELVKATPGDESGYKAHAGAWLQALAPNGTLYRVPLKLLMGDVEKGMQLSKIALPKEVARWLREHDIALWSRWDWKPVDMQYVEVLPVAGKVQTGTQ